MSTIRPMTWQATATIAVPHVAMPESIITSGSGMGNHHGPGSNRGAAPRNASRSHRIDVYRIRLCVGAGFAVDDSVRRRNSAPAASANSAREVGSGTGVSCMSS